MVALQNSGDTAECGAVGRCQHEMPAGLEDAVDLAHQVHRVVEQVLRGTRQRVRSTRRACKSRLRRSAAGRPERQLIGNTWILYPAVQVNPMSLASIPAQRNSTRSAPP